MGPRAVAVCVGREGTRRKGGEGGFSVVGNDKGNERGSGRREELRKEESEVERVEAIGGA